MPKLPPNVAKKVDDTESGSFEALPPDKYRARLMNVEQREGNKAPYWSWEYEVIEPEAFEGRKVWNNTSLSEKAFFKLKEAFEAHGATPDTDTDELCGSVVVLAVSQRVIEQGARKGETGNQVDRVLPDNGEAERPGDRDAGDDAGDEDLF